MKSNFNYKYKVAMDKKEDKTPMTRSERLKAQAFKNVMEKKKMETKKNTTRSIPTMTENERARLQGFKNFLEKRKAETGSEKLNNNFN